MDLNALLTLSIADKVVVNPKRIALLEQIRVTGSISQGAKLAGLSYKTAWDAVNDMNRRLSDAVVVSEKGGKGGGGAQLTDFGERLVQVYALTEQMQEMVLQTLLDQKVPMQSLLDVMAHFSLKTSARNQLTANIKSIENYGLNDRIVLETAGDKEMFSVVTHSSTCKLRLLNKTPVLLLIKAPLVHLSVNFVPDSGDNQLDGEVVDIKVNGNSVEVSLNIGNTEPLYASITCQQANEIDLSLGQRLYGVFKPEQVIIASMN
ncbi:TOBE domain-containing protein [Shewanella sp. D64]|uniref:TOBE domain-containing protein n=1 Tax=unclassified Shewanella TaxID=196818 RepID=UPI0022BA1B27|nr:MULTISPECIES: TOBE domain-containing protein [unclassified Shewanella]MEC4729038.1 TOBE domain-containing protein [Shewanella sp. D64]MEC4739887.1 TOBE domain-containing protein [Shewanella sp. E94]WBJ97146.1 TOBE domain-containing protein [Shewanella sp. MTB7]